MEERHPDDKSRALENTEISQIRSFENLRKFTYSAVKMRMSHDHIDTNSPHESIWDPFWGPLPISGDPRGIT